MDVASSRSTACEARTAGSREVANVWHNAIASEQRLWQQGKRTDGGPQGKCSRAPCRRLPLESHRSQSWLQYHAAKKTLKVPVEALGRSLVSGRGGLSGLSTDEKTSLKWDCRG